MKLMKNLVLTIMVIAVVGILLVQNRKVDVYSASSEAGVKYCMAIRGNGELEPAHWGAAARVIEQWGLPSAMAGGSSGSITMFILNGLAQNPFLSESGIGASEKRARAALMVKSFLGFFNELKSTKFSQDFFKLYGEFDKIKAKQLTLQMSDEFIRHNYKEVANLVSTGVQLGLFDLESMQPLLSALKNSQAARSKFYLQQLTESIQLFGKFDAAADANLFFRSGLINFKNSSQSLGRWAAFYAVPTRNSEVLTAWEEFLKDCTSDSINKSWIGLIKEKPVCGSRFHKIFNSYFADEPEVHLEDRQIGSPIPVYPSTSVLIGKAARQVEQAFIDYDKNLDVKFGAKFKIEDPEEIRFGYWGDANKLAQIDIALDKADEKNRRFLALGDANWKTVLSMSPAEPGLSPLIPFSIGKTRLISAGGWSDLHPINVLKASGCEKVVYLTRRGGESLFGQGVANRLMSLDRDLKKLNDSALNDSGDLTADPNSTWSRLFNLGNPKSSVNNSLSQAAAIACTNWNDKSLDVKKNLLGLVEDAYRSSFWISPNLQFEVPLTPVLQVKRPGCQPL